MTLQQVFGETEGGPQYFFIIINLIIIIVSHISSADSASKHF